jgi:hypothetical protein
LLPIFSQKESAVYASMLAVLGRTWKLTPLFLSGDILVERAASHPDGYASLPYPNSCIDPSLPSRKELSEFAAKSSQTPEAPLFAQTTPTSRLVNFELGQDVGLSVDGLPSEISQYSLHGGWTNRPSH